MRKMLKLAVIGALAGLIGGCAGLPGKGTRANLSATSLDTLFGVEDLADGREALRQGNTSLAIAAFRRAAINPRTAGEASNGLGIAYARLGRTDLAEVQFAKAIALSPDDTRFSANLSRLYRSENGERLLAHRRAEAARQFARSEALAARANAYRNPALPDRRGHLTFESTGSRIVRKDRKEVLLTTLEAGSGEAPSNLAAIAPTGLRSSSIVYLRDIPASRKARAIGSATVPAAPSVRDVRELSTTGSQRRGSERLRVRLPLDADY